MRKTLLFIALSIAGLNMQAQDVVGIWKTIDDTDNVEKSHIEIYQENGKLYGKVIKLLEGATMTHCTECTGPRKDRPIIDMVILSDLERDGEYYTGGEIFDPAKCKSYSCNIKLENSDKLYVRGYIGYSMFGRTQYWYRVQ